MKHFRNGLLVILQIGFKSHFQFSVMCLEFYKQQRNTIKKTNNIWTLSALRFASNPYYCRQESYCLLWCQNQRPLFFVADNFAFLIYTSPQSLFSRSRVSQN